MFWPRLCIYYFLSFSSSFCAYWIIWPSLTSTHSIYSNFFPGSCHTGSWFKSPCQSCHQKIIPRQQIYTSYIYIHETKIKRELRLNTNEMWIHPPLHFTKCGVKIQSLFSNVRTFCVLSIRNKCQVLVTSVIDMQSLWLLWPHYYCMS